MGSDGLSFQQTTMKSSWVVEIRSFIDEATEEDETIPVCIFTVPKSITVIHPEAYIPQRISVGPYHHLQDDLHEMDRHKLLVAKRVVQNKCKGLSFEKVVSEILKMEPRIRACYYKHLEIDGETLAWIMAIDGLFLLEFLQSYGEKASSVLASSSKMSTLVDTRVRKVGTDAILKDILMLENQIPLLVLRKLFKIQCESSSQSPSYDDKEPLATMLLGICKELSPLKLNDGLSPAQVLQHLHLLDLLYHMIVPEIAEDEEKHGFSNENGKDFRDEKHYETEIEESEEEEEDKDDVDENHKDEKKKKKKRAQKCKCGISSKDVFTDLWSLLMKINMQLFKGVQAIIFSKPMKVIFKLPWKLLSKLPLVSLIAPAIEAFLNSSDDAGNGSATPKSNILLVDEISIPSATALYNAGVNFCPTEGNITAINFDTCTLKFNLPIVEIDVNSEVVLRNLVAYEALGVSGPLVLARYTEFMNGIIDTAEDARVLRKKGIMVNYLKSDEEVADLWNGMSKSVRLTKVEFLDDAIENVKGYYENTWKVKGYNMMKKWVYGSWEVILLLATVLVLLLMTLQAFCTVYSCPRLFDIGTSVDDSSG